MNAARILQPSTAQELIDTQWNVNFENAVVFTAGVAELIDTQWNVNVSAINRNERNIWN